MRVALAYDDVALLDASVREGLPDDFGAEYESDATRAAILAAIEAQGHEAMPLPLTDDFCQAAKRARPDLVYNIAEGVRGRSRESIVPAWLDHLGIPYIGSDGLTLGVTLDKAMTKTLVAAAGVPTPAFTVVQDGSQLAQLHVELPAFVKPNAEGSSMGIRSESRVESVEQLNHQVKWVLRHYGDCLIETFAPGREFGVGLLGNDPPRVLPIAETRGADLGNTYDHKQEHRTEHICPADVSNDLAARMGELAIHTFKTLGCRDLSRVDFRLDRDGNPLFLEINALPGMCPDHSIFPLQARAAGMSYEQLIGSVIDHAMARHASGAAST